eukprot:10709242-Ditylum_brightwellii.AAC.1
MHDCSTHIHELVLPSPTWIGVYDAAGTVLGGAFFNTVRHCHVWTFPLPSAWTHHLCTSQNPTSDISMNVLKLLVHILQVTAQAQHVALLDHTRNGTNNTSTHSWVLKGVIVNNPLASALLLW